MDNNLRFEEFFTDRLRERGFDLKKLSEASGIAVKHLEALASGNFKALPPEPYFHGYLERLGQILEFDSEVWWQKLKGGGFVKSSGREDAMPRNRFIIKENAKVLWGAVVVIVVVLYLVFQLPRALGKPEITMIFPEANPAIVAVGELTLMGSAKGASELYVNNELVPLSAGALWEKTALLEPGLNAFEVVAKKFLGGETSIIQQVVYQPASQQQFLTP